MCIHLLYLHHVNLNMQILRAFVCRAIMVKDCHDIICHFVHVNDIAQNHSFVKSSMTDHMDFD